MGSSHVAEPRSYWHETAPPPIPAAPLPDAAEVVVIGGGLLGCWTAYWLARGGAAVTLIERTAIGWGPPGVTAGSCAPVWPRATAARSRGLAGKRRGRSGN